MPRPFVIAPSTPQWDDDLAELFSWIDSFTNFERRPIEPREYKLTRMAAILEKLGHPERRFRSIHIAGSKGKGSVAWYCGQILAASGLKVGLYASPHVLDWRERIRLAEDFFPTAAYREAGSTLRALVAALTTDSTWDHGQPTTFELLTALAFLVFANQHCDWAVVEVGLGGRLDATNLIHPELCLITHLELEHTDVLGPTLTHIATEKAGIMKPGIVCLALDQVAEARQVLIDQAKEHQVHLRFLADLVAIESSSSSPLNPTARLRFRDDSPDLSLTLSGGGTHQLQNAALAICALRSLKIELRPSAIAQGLSRPLPEGRQTLLERTGDGPGPDLILVDGAHTVSSMEALLVAWAEIRRNATAVGLFGLAEGKQAQAIAELLVPRLDSLVITRPGTVKKSDPAALLAICEAARGIQTQPTLTLLSETAEALTAALEACTASGGRLLVAGSFHLAAVVLPLLINLGYRRVLHGSGV